MTDATSIGTSVEVADRYVLFKVVYSISRTGMATTKSVRLTVGKKVLVKNVSLSFSDYKNLSGEVFSIHDDFVEVAVPKNKFSAEDLRDLRKDGDRALIKVKTANIV